MAYAGIYDRMSLYQEESSHEHAVICSQSQKFYVIQTVELELIELN